MSARLGMFAKFWQPGLVKTRLAASIGPDAAAELHHCCVRTLLARLAGAADSRVLVYAPAAHRNEFVQAVGGTTWQLEPQADGDLGARMEAFFSDSIAAGAGQTVLIGSDSPDMPLRLVRQAFELLQEYPVVLGPSHDGGYYLIGIQQNLPPIFHGISWSTPDVWRQTVDRLEEAGCQYAVLPPWYDVDEWPDLLRLSDELQRRIVFEPEFVPLLAIIRRSIAERG